MHDLKEKVLEDGIDVDYRVHMLAIDVGNTHITIAVVSGEEISIPWRIPTETCLETEAFFRHFDPDGMAVSRQIVISSVRREVCGIIERECGALYGVRPFIIKRDTPMGITNLYRSPETLGMDRLIDAAACHHFHTRGKRPGIIVDMGTATTIDYITAAGSYLGGAIAPGVLSGYRGLIFHAPELPEVDLSETFQPIGTTTRECLLSGVIVGHAAMVKALSLKMAEDRREDPLVVVTGGLSRVVDAYLPAEFIRDEHLMLRGLSIVYHINTNNC